MKKVLLSLLFAVCVMTGAMAQNNRVIVTTDTVACGAFTWDVNGQTYSQDTAVISQTPDTLYLLNLTVRSNVYTNDSPLTGDCFATWNGKIFMDAGTIHDTLPAAAGCDSIITRTLTLTKIHHDTLPAVQACAPYYWRGDTITVNPSAPLKDTIHSAAYNCDSISVLDLTIVDIFTRTDEVEHCGNFVWYDSTFTESTEYSFTDTTGYCDSVLSLHLTIVYQYDTNDQTACEKYKWHNNVWLNESDTYVDTTYNANNCGTVNTLNLTIVPIRQVWDTIAKSACTKVTHKFTNQSSAVSYYRDTTIWKTYTSRTVAKCYDSTSVVLITVKQPTRVIENISECDSFYWDSKEKLYTISSKDSVRAGNAVNGCDSMRVLNLTINQSPKILSIEGNLVVESGNSTTLTATSNKADVAYYWEVLGSSQVSSTDSITISNITGNTDVTLTLTDNQSQCSSQSFITIVCGLGIDEGEDANIRLYPNPTSALLNIESIDAVREAAIYNTMGQQVRLHRDLGSNSLLDLNGLSNGTYTLRMTLANGNVVVRKFIVKK